MTFQAYPAYKDSEITWIGDVPISWEVKPFKWLLGNNDGGVWGDDPTGEGDTFVLRSTDQTVDGNWKLTDPAPRKLSAKEKASALLVEGDLVVTKSSGSSLHIGKTTLVTADIAQQGCCYGNFMQRLRVNAGFTPTLAWYVMNNELARAQMDLLSNSTTGLANLNGTLIGEIILPVSSVAEQIQIARFLDHETGRIDALIEEQQRLVELLKEKRQAVISHAVTKGLDPNATMKDSGVEWLGEVPAHWAVRKLKNLVSVRGGSTPSKEVEHYWEGNIPWVSPKDMKSERIRNSIDHVSDSAIEEGGLNMVERGAVLIVVRGMILIHSVPVAITDVDVTINQDMKAMSPSAEISSDYLSLMLQGVRDAVFQYIDSSAHGTRKLEWERFELIDLPIPSRPEQIRIVSFIEKQKRAIDDLTGQAASAINLMKERRSALISSAVTGKIDVRGWQPPANVQIPELEEAV